MMSDHSYLYNGTFIDDLYESYLANPTQVGEEWREYFEQLQQEVPLSQPEIPHAPIQAAFAQRTLPLYNYNLHRGANDPTLAIFAKNK
ncbi:hypothetical protein BGP_4353 [Beggiatoa sp. PS]|nr:hypothetical protein BGP_4353 [Beggiatoa sp. PS]